MQAHHPEGDTNLPLSQGSDTSGSQPGWLWGSFCPWEAAEPWQRVLEQTKAVTLPQPFWAAAACSSSCRAGQKHHKTGEEAGGGFLALRAPQTPKGAPPPPVQCPQPSAGFAFQGVGYDGDDALAHRSNCSGSIS